MEKKLTRDEFAAALAGTGAKLKPEAAADPAKALKKLPSKAREQLLAQLGMPGGRKLEVVVEGEHVVLRAAGEGEEDRFAAPAPAAAPAAAKKRRFGRKARDGVIPQGQALGGDGEAPAAPGAAPPGGAPVMALDLLAPDGKGPAWKPPLADHLKEVDLYPVNAPYAWVRIVYDAAIHETTYNVLEPPLNEREQRVLAFLEDTLVDVIEIPLGTLTAEKKAEQVLLDNVNQIMYDYSILLDDTSKSKLMYYVQRDFLGFGLIDAVMRDDLIEDVSCDGPHVPIFIYHRKHESLKSNVQFMTHEALDGFVIRLAQRSGKHISIAEPLLDATLPDGSRLNATLSDEVTSAGSTFTVRKFKQTPFTPPDLVRFGTMSIDLLAYWWLAVQHGASAIYSGGTASGKTTSLNAILLFIPPTMKIVSIEDTRELNLPHLNWIPGITRSGFGPRDAHGRQAGEIDMFTLLKAALRQRPEYVLVGEVRGAEAVTLFQAMATGHTAYGTMHADSVEAVIHRLESEPIKVPRSLLEALDVVSVQIQTRINGKRVRRTKELIEIVGIDPHTHEILTNTVFLWNPASDQFEYSGVSYVLERIQQEKNWTPMEMREEWQRRKDIIRWLIERDVRDFKQVAKVIVAYYKEPENVIAYVRQDLAREVAQVAVEVGATPLHEGAMPAWVPDKLRPAPPAEAPAPAAAAPLPGGELPAVIEQAAAQDPALVEVMAEQMASASPALGEDLQAQADAAEAAEAQLAAAEERELQARQAALAGQAAQPLAEAGEPAPEAEPAAPASEAEPGEAASGALRGEPAPEARPDAPAGEAPLQEPDRPPGLERDRKPKEPVA